MADDDEAPPPPPPPPRTLDPPKRRQVLPPLPPQGTYLRARPDRLLAGPPLGPHHPLGPPPPKRQQLLLPRPDRLLAGPPPGPRHPLGPPPPRRTGPLVRTSSRDLPPLGTFLHARPDRLLADPPPGPRRVEVSSDDPVVSAAAMLVNIERSIRSAGEVVADAAAPPARELELPILVVSNSCLSIQQHLSSTSSQTSAEDTDSDPAAEVDTTGDPALSGQSQAKLPSKGYSPSCSSRMQGSSDDSTVLAAASLVAIERSIRSVGAEAMALEAREPELPSSVPSDSCLPTQHHLSSSSSSRTSAGDTNSDPEADVNTAGDPVVSGQSSVSN